jgi:hypothetical protein
VTVASPFAIPADAVRVWRGFRAPGMDLAEFYGRLNTVFIPATVQMQIDAGLDGYVPSVLAGLPRKPDTVPDETAILFWDSQQTYADGFQTLAVRTYTLTHGAVYTPESRADFPVPFAGRIDPNQPCYLVPRPADWMKGTVRHLAGGRPDGVAPDRFRASVAETLAGAQRGPAGAIACAGDDYLVYWQLDGGTETIDALTACTGWVHVARADPTILPKGMWEPWPGLDVQAGQSLNLQFERRWER